MPTKPKPEPETPPTAEIKAAETMAGDLLSAMIDEMKHAPDVWAKLSESKQRQVIERLTKRVTENVRAAVHIIASGERPTVRAVVESVTFKDGVKAVLKMHRTEGAHDLADAEGQPVTVVIADAEQYTGGTDEVEPDPDQQSIHGGEQEAA